MESRINYTEIEKKWQTIWENNKIFSSKVNDKKAYTIVMPPPNVTGSLHIGHALNGTFQDISIRYNKMRGYNTVWIPGRDHAGIATQNRVDKYIKETCKGELTKQEYLEKTKNFYKKQACAYLSRS